MDSVSLEQQIEVLKKQVRRVPAGDAKVLAAAAQTLTRLSALRQHLQKAAHNDETESDILACELLVLLRLPCPAE